MNRRTFVKTLPAATLLAGVVSGKNRTKRGQALGLAPIDLPRPEKDGGKSVLASLAERKTIRNISPEKLPVQVLSNLLWAAFGVNRDRGVLDKPGRTAP